MIVSRYVQFLLLITAGVVIASVFLWSRVADGVASLGDLLIERAGLAWPLILLWLLILLLALRFQPGHTFGRWYRWIGVLVLIAVAAGVASFFTLPWGRFSGVNVGGELGGYIAGDTAWLAPLSLAPLAFVGLIGIGPGIMAGLAGGLGSLARTAYEPSEARAAKPEQQSSPIVKMFSAPFRMIASLVPRRTPRGRRPLMALLPKSTDAVEQPPIGGWAALRKPTFGGTHRSQAAGPAPTGDLPPFLRRPSESRDGGAKPFESPPVTPSPAGPAPQRPRAVSEAWQAAPSKRSDKPIPDPDKVLFAEPVLQWESGTVPESEPMFGDEEGDWQAPLARTAPEPVPPIDEEKESWQTPATPTYARFGQFGEEEKDDALKWSGGGWKLPPANILQMGVEAPVDEEANRERAQLIEQTLADYGIEVAVTQIRPGPVVTMFGLTPGWVRRSRQQPQRDANGEQVRDERGRAVTRMVEERLRVKVDAILAREKDLALALACPNLRIEAPVPGENIVGLEVPNPTQTVVTLRSVMVAEEFRRHSNRSHLAFALGKGPGGTAEAADLGKMPHLLVAGSTGSGKSVFLNSIILSLIYQCTPLQLRLLLIDPKRVELTPLNGLPHLLEPVVVEPELVVRYLNGLLREMTNRYKKMEVLGVRNIQGYNGAVEEQERMPHIVVCLDELADLMMVAPHDTEQAICRLAQLGRATGIHLIVATQRPSVDVVTGLIKANFPSRVSFNVVSQIDSRTILDTPGAERLLGRGDMLFLPPESSKPRRIQSTYVSDDEIQAVLRFWKSQPCPPPPHIDLTAPIKIEERGGGGGHDEMFGKALKVARSQRQLSTSFLQRKLRIGYPRASRLREELEEEGVISPTGEVVTTVLEELLMTFEDEGW
jgi:S-DNA-T family DNA segregation ATPase FtsK/SpoIIIE